MAPRKIYHTYQLQQDGYAKSKKISIIWNNKLIGDYSKSDSMKCKTFILSLISSNLTQRSSSNLNQASNKSIRATP